MKRFISILLVLLLFCGCFPEQPYDLLPTENATYSVGSPARYWDTGYFGNLVVDNLTIAGVPVGGDNVTGTGTTGKLAKWTASDKIGNAANTDTEVASAVTLKHTQGTDTTLGTQTADLNMGTKAITNVGLVDGVDVSALSENSTWYTLYSRTGQAIIPLHNWYTAVTGSGGYAASGPTRIFCNLGATTNSSSLEAFWPMSLGSTQQISYGNSFKTIWKAFTVCHNDPTNTTSRLGYRNQVLPTVSTLAAAGVEIYVTGASNRLWLCTHNGATLTTLDTGYDLIAFRPYDIEFVFTTGTRFEVFVNGVSRGSITTNLPAGNTQAMGWFGTIRSGGTDVNVYAGSTLGIPATFTTYLP
jgi:hypothetical protein